ncbi:MAG: SDR family NAD(P)-dependent oxidoreductase, partial [Acidimicrobiia bacterium]
MNNHTTTVADDHSLAGQVVLVTGGSRGIGAATARAAAQAGAAVAIGFRQDADAAFSVVESIRETGKVA